MQKINESQDPSTPPSEIVKTEELNVIYVGRCASCRCTVAATIDADDVGMMARNGYLIETVIRETVEVSGCKCS